MAQQRELYGEAPAIRPQKGVDPGAVRPQHARAAWVERAGLGLGNPAKPDAAQQPVGLQRALAEQFRQPARGDPALKLHLPQPVLRMQVALHQPHVVLCRRVHMGHAPLVPQHLHLASQPGQLQPFPVGGQWPLDHGPCKSGSATEHRA